MDVIKNKKLLDVKKNKNIEELSDAARHFDQFLIEARNYLGPDVTALRLHILLNVFLSEGINQRALLQRLHVTSVTALSRNLADMSALTSSKRPGPGLLELRYDAMNLRSKTIHLTAKGKRTMTALLKRVTPAP